MKTVNTSWLTTSKFSNDIVSLCFEAEKTIEYGCYTSAIMTCKNCCERVIKYAYKTAGLRLPANYTYASLLDNSEEFKAWFDNNELLKRLYDGRKTRNYIEHRTNLAEKNEANQALRDLVCLLTRVDELAHGKKEAHHFTPVVEVTTEPISKATICGMAIKAGL